MKKLDIEKWNRKKHYEFFKELDYPHFNICANIDITNFLDYITKKKYKFFISMVFATTRVANSIKEFRYRIIEDEVFDCEVINPSFTIMSNDDVFSFCTAKYYSNYNEFLSENMKHIERTKLNIQLEDKIDENDVIYMTSLPWVTFTSVNHPIHMSPTDCIPRIAWGKYFTDGDKIMMPLSIQVHHGLVDGAHVGSYFLSIQEFMNAPENHM